jgi:hypothetical protein
VYGIFLFVFLRLLALRFSSCFYFGGGHAPSNIYIYICIFIYSYAL